MNGPQEKDTLLRLLRQAFDDQPIPPGPHFVDDHRFLARWSLGTLRPQERGQMIDHLASCPTCRSAFGIMLEDGALELPLAAASVRDLSQDESTSSVPEPTLTPAQHEESRGLSKTRRAWIVILATAAGLLFAVTVWFGRSPDTRLPRSVALTEFKYSLDGIRYAKGELVTEEQKQRRTQLQAAIQVRPDDARARLEYSYLLIEMGDPKDLAEASRQFQAVLDSEPGNPDARNGLGIALFRQDRAGEALPQFQAAAAGRAEDPAFQLNTAICLERLGRSNEARSRFETVLRHTRNSKLQELIREYLESRGTIP